MINFHLGLYGGDIQSMSFYNKIELCEYIIEIRKMVKNQVWLTSNGGEFANIFITEDLTLVHDLIITGFINYQYDELDGCDIHLHQYSSYEDAYQVAHDMREGNPLCYNNL